MRVHFIAIGGSAMHNLAIALHHKGYKVSGSDDEIFEPSKSRLEKLGLLPEKPGWYIDKIKKNLDAVILGMHAKADNPELLKARELGLKIYSYPEFLYQQSIHKTRVVIGGSHGKTTITSMILHVLNFHGIKADYMVGAQLEGFDVMVRLSEDAPFIILEGDEYLSSPLDPRPKFHLYKPHIALISGIAWDHINVFPTFEHYLDQFRGFIHLIEEGGKLIYCTDDEALKKLCEEEAPETICLFPYGLPDFFIENGETWLRGKKNLHKIQIFGKHNLLNISGARSVCNQLGISNSMFNKAIRSFKGASNRLERLAENDNVAVFKDFAHAPSKLQATIQAAREQYPERKLIAIMELHTYSSLNPAFIDQYRQCMDLADSAIVFYNPKALEIKKLPPIAPEKIREAFGRKDLIVITDSLLLRNTIMAIEPRDCCFLFMSSGNFGNLPLKEMALKLASY